MIFSSTPPDVAHAKVRCWQAKKEFRFAKRVLWLANWSVFFGLERKRIAKVLHAVASSVEAWGGA